MFNNDFVYYISNFNRVRTIYVRLDNYNIIKAKQIILAPRAMYFKTKTKEQ